MINWGNFLRQCVCFSGEFVGLIRFSPRQVVSLPGEIRLDYFFSRESFTLFMNPAALLSLKRIPDRDRMTMQYLQTSTDQLRPDLYRVLSSMRSTDSETKGLRVSFAFFQRNDLPDGLLNKTDATVGELSDCGKPGSMDGTISFVMNCDYSF